MQEAVEQAREALLSGSPDRCLALTTVAMAAAATDAAVLNKRSSDASAAAVTAPAPAAENRAGRGSPAGYGSPSAATLLRQLQQLQVLARIELVSGSQQSWWRLLGLSRGASQGEVRRRYRQLAAAVHPDKCSEPGARSAFQRLQQGVQALLGSLEQRGEDGGSREWPVGAKRRRTGGTSGRRARRGGEGVRGETEAGSSPGGSEGADWLDDDEWLASDNGGFPWWGEWDEPAVQQPGAGCCSQAGVPATASGGSGAAPAAAARQPDGSGSGHGGGADSGGAAEQQQQELQQQQQQELQQQGMDEEDIQVLGRMGLEQLRAEVRQRQQALLAPAGARVGGGARPLSVRELQERLRRAKDQLLARVREQAAAAAPREGGFIRGAF